MSRLDYEFAPIDVAILAHPKACAAGPEAMGLWLWGQAYAKWLKTDGRIHRAPMLVAWGGKRNIMLARKLVEVGLWIAREDGDWDVYNYETKTPARASSAERMRKLRERKKAEVSANDVTPSDVTVTPSDVTVTRHALRECSPSPSISVTSVSDQGGAGGRPAWVDGAFDSAEMSTGEKFDRGTVWFTYANARDDAGRATNAADFKRYLGSWASRQKSDRENRRQRVGAIVQSADNRAWKLPENMP